MIKKRCSWVKLNEPIYITYHDHEWSKILNEDNDLFELFSLETQMAGLNWLTVLKKRNEYKKAFYNFDIQKVSCMPMSEIDEIIKKYLVIKNPLKLKAIINNAKKFIQIQHEYGSIYKYFWSKINYEQIIEDVKNAKIVPTTSQLSDIICKDLKKKGFKFIGSITIYSFMCASGMIDNHENRCFLKNRKKRSFMDKINLKLWEYQDRIYYEDVDVGGYCYHSKYLNFCERARSDIFFSQGKSPISDTYHFVAKSLQANFKKSALFGDKIIIKTHVTKLKKASMIMSQKIYNQKNELLFELKIVLVCLNGTKISKIPDEIFKIFN